MLLLFLEKCFGHHLEKSTIDPPGKILPTLMLTKIRNQPTILSGVCAQPTVPLSRFFSSRFCA